MVALSGRSLIVWSIGGRHEPKYTKRLILSSDDEEIMEVAEQYDCEVRFRRPNELARDDTPSMDALLHAMEQMEDYDYVVLIQPTSPLRTAGDIDATIETCIQHDAPACVTVTETDKLLQWMYTLDDEKRLRPVLDSNGAVSRRQEVTANYVLNGAAYVARADWIRETESFLLGMCLQWAEFLVKKGFAGLST